MSKASFALRTTPERLDAIKDLAERDSVSVNEYINNVLDEHIEIAGDIHSLRTLLINPRESLVAIFNNNFYEQRGLPAILTDREKEFIILGCSKALNNVKLARTRRQEIKEVIESATVGSFLNRELFDLFGLALCGHLPRLEDRIEFAAMVDQPDIESRSHRFEVDNTEILLLINGNLFTPPKEDALLISNNLMGKKHPLAALILTVRGLNITYGWETIASLYRVMSDFKQSNEDVEQRHYADLHIALERRKGPDNKPLWLLIIGQVQCNLSQEGIEQLASELIEFLGDYMADLSSMLGEY
ncbi:hypothetical protein [Rosenbergiella collisarenosi]|uniref:hypothetical protein n=1 Tax=Rosenbergiella collisarenosi TaxID=1544695 RepID=UPI001F4E9974|nr:hypothetical protein [Rosenbergiella collisarenosi]